MLVQAVLAAALAAAPCPPPPELAAGPTLTNATRVQVLDDAWAVTRLCVALGAAPPRPKVTRSFDGRWLRTTRHLIAGCYDAPTDTAYVAREAAVTATAHELGHAQGLDYPGTLDGCGPWVRSTDLARTIILHAVARAATEAAQAQAGQ